MQSLLLYNCKEKSIYIFLDLIYNYFELLYERADILSKLLDEKIIYDGPRFKITQRKFEREDGLIYSRDCVEPGDAVVILPITENNEIVFIRQLRESIGKISLELPAGMVEKGEDTKIAALRELEEETGITANNIEFLTTYYASCGYSSEKLYIYVAKDFKYGEKHTDETEEILNLEKIKIEDALARINDDDFCHASTKIAIFTYYYKNYNGGKK